MRMHIVMLVLIAIVPLVGSAQTPTANLRITVQKQSYGEDAPKPFPGVGVFDLFRGDAKMDGASCPDRSSQAGEVRCQIPCRKNAKNPMVVRVRPPSDQDSLAGWVTPPHQDVQLRGCSLDPAAVTMRYEDAKYALNKLLHSRYFADAAPPVNGGGGGSTKILSASSSAWLDAANNPTLTAKIADVASTTEGRAAVADLYRIASEAANNADFNAGKLSPEEAKQYEALTRWQVLSKNALLTSKLKTTLPADQLARFKFKQTSDLAVYRENLNTADRLLTQLPSKSPEQLKLSDDVKTLKSLPATGKDAAPAGAIIKAW